MYSLNAQSSSRSPRGPWFQSALSQPCWGVDAVQVTDYGLRLLRLAAEEFWFTADYVGALLSLMRDSTSRVRHCLSLPSIAFP